MVKKRLIAIMTGTVLLFGSAVPAFAENENTTSGIVIIADDGETVIEGVEEEAGEPDGGLIPTDLGLLLAGDPDEAVLPGGISLNNQQKNEYVEGTESAQSVGAADLPSSYRPDDLPAVENQGFYNTCWAFAALKSSEINLLKQGFGEGTDFSELQLIYGVFNGDGDTWNRSGSWYNSEGNYVMAASALARHYGAADENVYPYNPRLSFSEDDRTTDIAVIDHVIMPGSWPTDEGSWKGDAWEAKTLAIKELLYEEGAMSVSFDQDGNYDEKLNSYYTGWSAGTTKPAADHAVTLIGWDDEKETQEGTGAFLAMNSWGDDWGESGLFWISYNDASLSDPAVYVMEEREPGAVRDDTVFCYTGTGYASTAKSTNATRGANIFTADTALILDRTGFYLPANASYTARVLTNLTDLSDPSSGTEAAVVTGTAVYGGFYKADLPETVLIGAGESFAVELTIRAGDRNCVLFEGASTSSKTTACSAGESFYYNGTSWSDSTSGVVVGSKTYDNLGNIAVYAYGISEGMEAVDCDADADGLTGLADLLTVLRSNKGLTTLTNYGKYAADMNGSGSVDGDDAALIAGVLIKEIK